MSWHLAQDELAAAAGFALLDSDDEDGDDAAAAEDDAVDEEEEEDNEAGDSAPVTASGRLRFTEVEVQLRSKGAENPGASDDVDIAMERARRRKFKKSRGRMLGRRTTKATVPFHLENDMIAANECYMSGRYDEAIERSMRIAEQAPKCPDPFNTMAMAYAGKGDWAKAIECKEKQNSLGKKAERDLVGLADLLKNAGQLDRAWDLYNIHLKKYPFDLGALQNMAEVAIQKKDLRPALRMLITVLTQVPRFDASDQQETYLLIFKSIWKVGHSEGEGADGNSHVSSAAQAILTALSKAPQSMFTLDHIFYAVDLLVHARNHVAASKLICSYMDALQLPIGESSNLNRSLCPLACQHCQDIQNGEIIEVPQPINLAENIAVPEQLIFFFRSRLVVHLASQKTNNQALSPLIDSLRRHNLDAHFSDVTPVLDALNAARQHQLADELCQQIRNLKDRVVLKLKHAVAKEGLGQLLEAADLLKEVLQILPDNTEAVRLMERVRARLLGNEHVLQMEEEAHGFEQPGAEETEGEAGPAPPKARTAKRKSSAPPKPSPLATITLPSTVAAPSSALDFLSDSAWPFADTEFLRLPGDGSSELGDGVSSAAAAAAAAAAAVGFSSFLPPFQAKRKPNASATTTAPKKRRVAKPPEGVALHSATDVSATMQDVAAVMDRAVGRSATAVVDRSKRITLYSFSVEQLQEKTDLTPGMLEALLRAHTPRLSPEAVSLPPSKTSAIASAAVRVQLEALRNHMSSGDYAAAAEVGYGLCAYYVHSHARGSDLPDVGAYKPMLHKATEARVKGEADPPPFYLTEFPWKWTSVHDKHGRSLLYHHLTDLGKAVEPETSVGGADSRGDDVAPLLDAIAEIRILPNESVLIARARDTREASTDQQQAIQSFGGRILVFDPSLINQTEWLEAILLTGEALVRRNEKEKAPGLLHWALTAVLVGSHPLKDNFRVALALASMEAGYSHYGYNQLRQALRNNPTSARLWNLINDVSNIDAEAAAYGNRFVYRVILKHLDCASMAEPHVDYGNHSLMSSTLTTAIAAYSYAAKNALDTPKQRLALLNLVVALVRHTMQRSCLDRSAAIARAMMLLTQYVKVCGGMEESQEACYNAARVFLTLGQVQLAEPLLRKAMAVPSEIERRVAVLAASNQPVLPDGPANLFAMNEGHVFPQMPMFVRDQAVLRHLQAEAASEPPAGKRAKATDPTNLVAEAAYNLARLYASAGATASARQLVLQHVVW